MAEGKVRFFNAERGWGFIHSDGQDYFAHFKEVNIKGYRTLHDGQMVTFTPGKSAKGNVALNIVPLGADTSMKVD